jgi:excisionase family DNA binding protein
MKTTLDSEDVELIARRVADLIKSMLNQTKPDGDPVFDVDGLAKYLCVGKQWVYQKLHTREIPHFKMGKYPRFRKSRIDEWLDQTEPLNGKKR